MHSNKARGCRTVLAQAVFLALGAAAASAWGQAAGNEAQAMPAAATDESGLPLTKVVVSRKEIESGAEQEGYGEAVKNVPGAMSNNGKGSANDAIRFRGLQLGLYSNYRINGGLAITNIITVPTENKEKVEALKGANALMYGLASPAGILNMVTKRATRNDVSTVTISGNAFGQYGAAVDLGRQFGDERQFGLRVNASGTHIETGVRGIGGSGKFFSLAGDWRATRDLSFKVDYENYRKDVVEQAGIVPPTAVKGVIAVPRVPDPRNLLSGSWDVYRPRTENTVLRVEYRLTQGWDVLAEAGESRSERSRIQARVTLTNIDTGDGKENILFIKDQHYDNTYRKAELRGSFDTGPVGHQLTLGYSSAQRDSNIPSTYSPTAANNNRPINIYAPVEMPAPVDPNTPLTYSPNTSRDSGVYVYDAAGLGHGLKLLVGLRRTNYEFKQTRVANGPQVTTTFNPTAKGAGLLWDLTPQTQVYTSYMQAMEDGPIAPSGPIQGKAVTNAFAVLEPAISTQREIGVRSSEFKGLFFNVNYFDIVKQNTNLVSDSPSSVNFQYDGSLHLYGLELQGSATLAKGWELSTSAQLMHSRQQGGLNDGMSTENTPDTIYSVNLAHQSQWLRGLTLRAGMSHVGPRYIGNAQQGAIPGVTLLNASAGYQTRIWGHRSSLQVGVDNLTNKRYWNSATSSAFGAGMDRAIRFSAKVDF